MNAPALITRRSLEQLEADIINHSSRIKAMERQYLARLEELDRLDPTLKQRLGISLPTGEGHPVHFPQKVVALAVARESKPAN